MTAAQNIVLVTGAAGAIGCAICDNLLANDCTVIALDLPAHLPDTAAQPRPGLHWLPCDVTSKTSLENAVEIVESVHGAIRGLVNVAGIVSKGSAMTLDGSELNRVMNINVNGTLLACQIVGRRMMRRNQGAIVNMGSVVGKNGGNPRPWLDITELDYAANVAYGMSKSAVHTMTCFLAKELAAFGIRVNAVAPGPIATGMTAAFPQTLKNLIPLGRMGQPKDVANAVEFLLSERAAFISGEVIDVNGAMWCD